MKVRKKVLATLLAAVTMLSMGVTAFAQTPTGGTESITPNAVTLKKEYIVTNKGTTSPEETFNFSAENYSVTDATEGISVENMPEITIRTVKFVEGGAGENSTADIEVTLPTYNSVGIYTYKITERTGSTAGVKYDLSPVYLKVTVYRGEGGSLAYEVATRKGEPDSANKIGTSAAFSNEYQAGNLEVKKTVAGNLGDQKKEFDFTVVFTKPEGNVNVNSTVKANIAGVESTITFDWNEEGSYSYPFSLSHDETATFSNLPYGVSYAISETDYSEQGYTTVDSGNSTGVIGNASQAVTFTNTKDGGTPDTGITLDTLPYILVFGLVMIAAVVMIMRKYRVED